MPRRVWAILAVAFGVSSSVISGAIVNIALPTFCAEMHVSSADSVWLVNSYQLATVMTLLIFSNLGDIIGYRRIYVAGLMLFTAASLGCSLSVDFTMLIICRTCAGIGAAAVTSVNTTLIRIIYPRNRLARGLGLNATIVAISSVIGPPLAAAVLSFASWHWLFAINIPIGLTALTLSYSFLPSNPVRISGRRLDKLDCLLNALSFGLLIFSIEAFSHDVDIKVVAATLAATIVIGWFYVHRQLHKQMPLLPFDLLRIPIFSLSILTSICSFAAQTLAMVSLPFILQHNMGYSAVDTGLVLMAWPMVIMFIAPMAGRMVEHIHAGVLGVAGLTMMTAGLLALGLMPAHLGTFDIVWRLVLCGVG
ncbi:MAG: MFS transporter, partial [Alistipes sp.]|nr:MFS transporter [Alistipes sp.]